jgi:hypothetical protein
VKAVLPREGPGVSAPPFLTAVLLVDLLVAAGFVGGGVVAGLAGRLAPPAWAPWALAAYGLLLLSADVAAARMRPGGLTWRRRLGFLAMAAAVWRGGPFSEPRAVALAIVLYMGVVWIALVTGGRALSRAIAGATGEDRPE